jgi:hypothetical protein
VYVLKQRQVSSVGVLQVNLAQLCGMPVGRQAQGDNQAVDGQPAVAGEALFVAAFGFFAFT